MLTCCSRLDRGVFLVKITMDILCCLLYYPFLLKSVPGEYNLTNNCLMIWKFPLCHEYLFWPGWPITGQYDHVMNENDWWPLTYHVFANSWYTWYFPCSLNYLQALFCLGAVEQYTWLESEVGTLLSVESFNFYQSTYNVATVIIFFC